MEVARQLELSLCQPVADTRANIPAAEDLERSIRGLEPVAELSAGVLARIARDRASKNMYTPHERAA